MALRPGKPLALLVYLCAAEGRPVAREQLADLLWGDESPDNARASLRQAVYALRQILGEERLLSDRETVAIAPGALQSDRELYTQASRRGDLREMLAIAPGPFCDFGLASGASEFERWLLGERLRLDTMLVAQAAAGLATLAATDAPAARSAALALDARFPARSDVVVLCFDTLVATGALAEAAERLAAHLAWLVSQDFEVPPAVEERLARLRRAAGAQPPVVPAGLFAVGRHCVGRDALLQDLMREADAAREGQPHRVLLLGPAGVGKTRILDEFEARLRLSGARVLRVGFVPGMADIECAGLIDVVRALSQLPGALGIAERSARRLLTLLPELAARFPGPAREGALVEEGLRGLPEALEDLLAAVSEDRLVVLMLDNMDFADLASLQVFSGSRLRPGSRLLAVGTSRVGMSPALAVDGTTLLEVLPLGEEHLRALLESVARLPAAPWTSDLVATLQRRSRGMPQVALAAVRSLGASGLLRVVDGEWRSDAPETLLVMARETAGTRSIVADLDGTARLLLEVLAVWGRPMDEPDLMGCLAFAEPPVGVESVRARLRRLEALGLVQLRERTWEIAHDSVAEELARSATPVQGEPAQELLLRYFGTPERLSPGVLEQLAFVAGRAPMSDFAGRVVARAQQSAKLRAAGLAGPALAQRVARAAGRPEWEAGLTARLGFFGRRSEAERVALAVVSTVLTLAFGALLSMLQPRLVLETDPMVDAGAPGEVSELVVQPRLAVRNGFGRPLALDVPVRVRADHGTIVGDTLRQTVGGRLQFEQLALRRGPRELPPRDVGLQFEGPWYLRGLRVHPTGLNTAQVSDEFRLVSLTVNGRPVPDSLVIEANLRDSLRFDLTFEYTTVQATANYIVGAMPLWAPREHASIRLAGLPRPVFRAWRSVTFAVAPPDRPGEHHLVVLMDLEDTVEHMFSSTNWQVGAPRWYDGNDVPDLGHEVFEALRRDGRATFTGRARARYRVSQGGFRAGDAIQDRNIGADSVPVDHLVGRALRIRFLAD